MLRHDHPFWKTNYPPNGWGCGCTVVAVRASLDDDKTEPPTGWDEIDAKTGEPPGIDKGWGYAPGASVADELRRFVQNKIATLDAPLGTALWQDTAPLMSAPLRKAAEDFVRETTTAMQAKGESALMHVIHPDVAARMAEMGRPMATAGVWLADDVLLHSIRDTKAAKSVALPSSTWENLPALLEQAKVYLDTEDNRLLFVFSTQETSAGKSEKVAVAVDYVEKTHVAGAQDKRAKMLSNYIRMGSIVPAPEITSKTRYVLLKD